MKAERWAPFLLASLLLAGCAEQEEAAAPDGGVTSGETPEQPYAGFEDRPIRALSEEQVEDLLEGRGAGYALTAELNHYPGPRHALDLAGDLGLTARQERDIQDVYSTMQEEARPLGRELVELEERLDRSFRDGEIDEEELAQTTDRIAGVEGRLRAAHLSAHLDLKEILDPDQVATYDRLRGYAGAADPGEEDQHAAEGHNPHDAGH